MASRTRNKKKFLIALGLLTLPCILGFLSLGVWQLWRDLEAYQGSRHHAGIDAEVISTNAYRLTLSGVVRFRFSSEGRDLDCTEKVVLGNESDARRFRPGTIIKILPRSGCGDPMVITSVRFPVIPAFSVLLYLAYGLLTINGLRSLLRRDPASRPGRPAGSENR